MAIMLALTMSACGVAAASRPDDTLLPLIPAESFGTPTSVATTIATAVDLPPDARVRLVADVLSATGYETLRAAWTESDVWERIAGRPITVLAPSERRFQALPQDIVRNMLADQEEVDRLIARHVLVGVYRYDQFAGLTSVTDLDGDVLAVRVGPDGVVYIDEAAVLMPLSASVSGADGQPVAVFGYSKVIFDLG